MVTYGSNNGSKLYNEQFTYIIFMCEKSVWIKWQMHILIWCYEMQNSSIGCACVWQTVAVKNMTLGSEWGMINCNM